MITCSIASSWTSKIKLIKSRVDFISIIGNIDEIESKYKTTLNQYLIPRIYITLNNDEQIRPLSSDIYNYC